MFRSRMAMGLSSAATFPVLAADFDGTDDYMTRGAAFTGISSSTQGIFSCWVRFDGGDGSEQTLLADVNVVCMVRKKTDNKVEITLWDTISSNILAFNSSAITAGATWVHILASWDTGTTPKVSHLYVTDVSDKTVTVNAVNPAAVLMTGSNWGVGARTGGSNKLDGCLAELYFAPGQFLDFSNSVNRRKFITSGGKPVNLGADGSVPTGVAPIAYFSIRAGGAAADLATNKGTGGNMTITGTLALASSNPSD
jgi:hypothetical protein